MTLAELPHDLRCDNCIVGAGPAGLALAEALIGLGRTVVILESAASGADSDAATLNIAPTSGDPFQPLQTTRARAIGGTTAIWSTLRGGVVGGKYVPLDPIDLEARTLTPWSGWPISHPDLDPWYAAAYSAAGLAPPAAASSTAPSLSLLPFPADSLTTSSYHWGSAGIYTQQLPAALDASPHATILRGATAIGFDSTADHAQVRAVRWAALSGARGTVHANTVVLAAGTIENTRLLLSLFQDTGRAAPHWLGRGFMEHPIDRSLTLVSRHPALSPDPGYYAFAGRGARTNLIGRIGLSAKLMRDANLRNASLRIFPVRHRFVSRQLRQLSHRLGRTPATTYRVLLDLEQAPHPDNRVTLTDQLDRLGRPTANLHWQWRPEDEAFRMRLLPVIQREFSRCAAGEIQITTGPPLEASVHHHAGTTRMHQDPGAGVVDSDLRVHGHANLFVAGASVFPTCGVANPTLTVLALALRLADHLGRG